MKIEDKRSTKEGGKRTPHHSSIFTAWRQVSQRQDQGGVKGTEWGEEVRSMKPRESERQPHQAGSQKPGTHAIKKGRERKRLIETR